MRMMSGEIPAVSLRETLPSMPRQPSEKRLADLE